MGVIEEDVEEGRSLVDLHTHTHASDGLLAPAALVELASQRGLSVLGITDHDTVDGLPSARVEAERRGVTLVPGVELSTTGVGRELHILGYFVDDQDDVFVRHLCDFAAERRDRIARMVERLNAEGYPVDLERVWELASDGSVGRPHIARALLELGVVADIGDAFDRFLTRGRPVYVPRTPYPPENALALLLANGAVPVLAHPFSTGDVEHALRLLVPAGLRGMEVFYGAYDDTQRAKLEAMAAAWNLIPTGGSDYHGTGVREGRELGNSPVPLATVARLRAVAAELHR
ncbi:MAG: PHP domain-containing protein [Chloroflexia bacterium]|nr:PHP domain-containing protein [Chloroflexia bacterium]